MTGWFSLEHEKSDEPQSAQRDSNGPPMHQVREYPTRAGILELLARNIYGIKILNNSHRGDIVEMMVLAALGEEWRFVGLGWHPWDLQRGSGPDRVRIQVKQSAAMQVWGKTRKQVLSFGWSKAPPGYFERDNPGESIETEGWFCEVFVMGIHDGTDADVIDQVDPRQWRFLVIPARELRRGTDSMALSKAKHRWPTVSWGELRAAVDAAITGATA